VRPFLIMITISISILQTALTFLGIILPKKPITQLYQNDGRGNFTDVTLQARVGDLGYGVGCCVGDYNNDDYLDLYVTNYRNNVLYKSKGNGTFVDVTDQANVGDSRWGSSCAFADYDNDGDLDLYVTNYVQFDFEKHKTCRFNDVETYWQPQDFQGESDLLYQNNGNGTFTNVTREAGVYNSRGRGLGVVWGDLTTTKTPISISRMTPTTTISIKIMVTENLQMLLSTRGAHWVKTEKWGVKWALILVTSTMTVFWI